MLGMEKKIVTLEVDEATLRKMSLFYLEDRTSGEDEKVFFVARSGDVSITAYKKLHNKAFHKVVFQGEDVSHEIAIWDAFSKKEEAKKPVIMAKKHKTCPKRFVSQIGSDEVGTGDFFGPVCVVASYVDIAGLAKLEKLGVKDSKKLNDEDILRIGPTLIKEFDYSSLSLDNLKYNEVHEGGLNMNAIKAKMHNRCLHNVHLRHQKAMLCQDQFAEEDLYYSYLKDEKDVEKDIIFETKGESKFPSVALASCIARYSFLRKIEEMRLEYGEEFPLGAGENVDAFASYFLNKYVEEEFKKVAKCNFATYKKLFK